MYILYRKANLAFLLGSFLTSDYGLGYEDKRIFEGFTEETCKIIKKFFFFIFFKEFLKVLIIPEKPNNKEMFTFNLLNYFIYFNF